MKPIRTALAAALVLSAVTAARGEPGDVIPRPAAVTAKAGQLTLSDHTPICIDDDALQDTARVLADLLGGTVVRSEPPAGAVLLTRKGADAALGDERYQLSVRPDGVTVRAATTAGLFYGVQSLRQMLPATVEGPTKAAAKGGPWAVPCVEVSDAPRCRWRGLMLDVSRHFFDVAEVERVLDVMALHKMNTFHWHLTDDQGWRIEIKKYPKLTERAAWRDGIGFGLDPKRSTHYDAASRYGGFYTQDDVRAVVAYAAKLHITVVPEIEMPGHALAALSAYPQFASTTQPIKVGTTAGVMDGIYNAGDDATFGFLDDVLTEVAGLFPGPFIHVGGDEVPKGPWKKSAACQARMKALGLKNEDELQSYFIKRVEKIVEAKGKRLIGWDEILEGGLAPGALVMSWHGVGGAVAAAKAGHDVILSPTSNAYLDYAQTRRKGQPPTGGGYLPLAKVYGLNPMPPGLSAEQAAHVLGAQGNVWTEYMPNIGQVELMAFPRALAIAEVTWTPAGRTDLADFRRRLAADEARLDAMGVAYFHGDPPTTAQTPVGQWTPKQMSTEWHPLSWDATAAVAKPGKYRVTLQYTGGACRLDVRSVAMTAADGNELARDAHAGTTGAAYRNNVYTLDVPAAAAGAKLTITAQVRSDGGTDSSGTVGVTPE